MVSFKPELRFPLNRNCGFHSPDRRCNQPRITHGVKKQVELCIFDLGQTGYTAKKAIKVDVTVKKEGCSNTAANSGNGWRLGLPGDYATKFVKTIGVDANGVITATAIKGNGLNEAVIQVIPMNGAATADNGVIDWQRNTNEAVSTCIKEDLC